MELKGSVVLEAQVSNAAGGESIDLTPGKSIIKYTDYTQSKMFVTTGRFTATGLGSADTNKVLERGEVYCSA